MKKLAVFKKNVNGIKLWGAELSENKHSEIAPIPDTVTLLMPENVSPVVKIGERVSVGQKIGEPIDSKKEIPVYSSVSGEISEISEKSDDNGKTLYIKILCDKRQTVFEKIEDPKVTSKESLVSALKSSGIVSKDSGKPLYLKIKRFTEKKPEYLIINAADFEPYITVNDRECIESAEDIAFGIRILKKWLKPQRTCISITKKQKEAINSLVEHIGMSTQIRMVSDNYPNGNEKIIIYLITGETIEIKHNNRFLVLDIFTVSSIGKYLRTGIPITDTMITVSGPAIKNPCNLVVPLGISYADAINSCGGFRSSPGAVVSGSIMTGKNEDNLEFTYVDQALKGIIAIDKLEKNDIDDCIRCGRCVSACPMKLVPPEIEKALAKENTIELKSLHPDMCIECGCCEYICPAKRKLLSVCQNAKFEVVGKRFKSGGKN